MLLRRALVHCLFITMALFVAFAPQAIHAEAMGIGLEGFPYPYPVHFMPITLEGEDLRLAYMDAPPVGPSNGRTVVLLHGRNFPSLFPTKKNGAAQGEIELVAGLHFSADPDKIEALIGNADEPSRFFIGFAGWGPGQLEAEMAQDSWLITAATPEQVFDAPHDLWLRVMRQISTSQLIEALQIKHVPADPSLN